MTFDITKYRRLEPEKWAAYVAECFDAVIGREVAEGASIKRTLLPLPARYGDRLEVGGVPVYFDHAYVAFDLDFRQCRYFSDVRDVYLAPCGLTLGRYVDFLAPYSDEIILAPIETPVNTPEAGLRVWETTAVHKDSTVVDCGIYQRDGKEYVALELAIAAKLKEPPADHADYLAKTAEYLGLPA